MPRIDATWLRNRVPMPASQSQNGRHKQINRCAGKFIQSSALLLAGVQANYSLRFGTV